MFTPFFILFSFVGLGISSPTLAAWPNCVDTLVRAHRQLRSASKHIRAADHGALTAWDHYTLRQMGLESGYRYVPTGSNGESGDYYHLHLRTDGRLLILLGDVSSAGEEAAPLAQKMRKVLASSDLRAQLEEDTATGVLIGINQTFMLAESDRDTALAAVLLDFRTGQGEFAGAMHAAPIYIKRSTGVVRVDPGFGMPICRGDDFADFLGAATPFQLEVGDTLLLTSDGLLDGITPGESRVGALFHTMREKIPDILRAAPPDLSLAGLIDLIYQSRSEQEDDEMVLLIRWMKRANIRQSHVIH